VGGEEFTILFTGKSVAETVPHLDQLRQTIETTAFRLRGSDRRVISRGPERRAGSQPRTTKPAQLKSTADLAVTVSIGVAGSHDEMPFESIVGRADKALYRAKENGRNRVEVDGKRSQEETRPARKKNSGRIKTA
jgi:PleD family two-component response regulator